jgi:hypothetical protein
MWLERARPLKPRILEDRIDGTVWPTRMATGAMAPAMALSRAALHLTTCRFAPIGRRQATFSVGLALAAFLRSAQ